MTKRTVLSKKTNKFHSKTQKDNRLYYYKIWKEICSDLSIDPHTTYGKFIMSKIINNLRTFSRLRKSLQNQSSHFSKLNIELSKLHFLIKQENLKLRNEAVMSKAHELIKTNNPILNFFYKYFTLLYFLSICICLSIDMSLRNFYLISILVILITHIFVHKIFNKKLKEHIKISEHENYKITGSRELNASAECKANEILRTKQEIDIITQNIELEKNSIKLKTQKMMSEEKIQFILSDFFYNSTDWKKIRQKAFEIHINKCSFCSTTINLTVDHILPRSKFPEKALEVNNTQILCLSCNSSKGNKLIK